MTNKSEEHYQNIFNNPVKKLKSVTGVLHIISFMYF